MNATAKLTKVEDGHYEYKGRTIYRTTKRRDAYNPWKVMLSGQTFPTLAAAKAYVDTKEVTNG